MDEFLLSVLALEAFINDGGNPREIFRIEKALGIT